MKIDTTEDTKRIAGGAGLAFLGRLGALVEAISLITFTWAYGAATFGLFIVLWSYVKVGTAISDLAMTTALQRYVPKQTGDAASQTVGTALKYSVSAAGLLALCITFGADTVAGFINAGDNDKDHLVNVIRLYAWVLPFWTFVEVSTAAIRANRTFGPEIRIRIFYEQGMRLVTAMIFAWMGYLTYGLFIAHLISVMLAGLLALRLVMRVYNLQAVLTAPMISPHAREMLGFGLSVMPANMIKRLFSEFPVMFLNMLLPGVAGAAAAGYYAVARKVASALQVVRLTFEYVMAPLASEKAGEGNHHALNSMFAFSTRLSIIVALPSCATLIIARHDILSFMPETFAAASTAIIILCLGRMFEAISGPATSVIDVLGHKALPTSNGITGMATLIGLGWILIPSYGVTGAAIAAAVGMNITAWLALLQTVTFYGLRPYSVDLVRPFSFSFLLSCSILSGELLQGVFSAPFGLIMATCGLIVALLLIIRYGISRSDAEALGPKALKFNAAK